MPTPLPRLLPNHFKPPCRGRQNANWLYLNAAVRSLHGSGQDANRYNAGMPMVAYAKGTYQMVFGHNFYDALTGGGFPCEVKLKKDGSWTQCGGYQVRTVELGATPTPTPTP